MWINRCFKVSGKRSFEAALDASSSNRVKNHSGKLVTHLKKEIKAEVHSDDDLPLSSRIKDSSSKKRKIKESDDEYSELVLTHYQSISYQVISSTLIYFICRKRSGKWKIQKKRIHRKNLKIRM